MANCYLGLGSNLRSPRRQIHQAYACIKKIPKTVIQKKSPLLCNKAMGVRGQPNYVNAVIHIHTRLPPSQLLKYCQSIEKQQGRLRKKRWGARTLDIDILLYDHKIQTHQPNLQIPHPRLMIRPFWLEPLIKMAPRDTLQFLDIE